MPPKPRRRKPATSQHETAAPALAPPEKPPCCRTQVILVAAAVVALAVATLVHDVDPIAPLPSTAAQLAFARRAGVEPLTVVRSTAKGLGVFYAGDADLPAGAAVGVFRALLVAPAELAAWRADGTVDWDFWRRYAVTVEEDGGGGSYVALPVGELTGLDAPTWWRQGPLDAAAVAAARGALRRRALVDWRRLAGGPDGPALPTGHLLNEPSPGEDEAVGHLAGSGCAAFGGGAVCGAALVAVTRRAARPGDELTWCYGARYARDYAAAPACLDDAGWSVGELTLCCLTARTAGPGSVGELKTLCLLGGKFFSKALLAKKSSAMQLPVLPTGDAAPLPVDLTGGSDLPHKHASPPNPRKQKRDRSRSKRRGKLTQAQRDALGLDERWDRFYAQKGVRFYKDRHWLRRELLELMPPAVRDDPMRWCAPLASDGTGVAVDVVPATNELARMTVGLEAGCGCGSAAFPLLRANDDVFVLATDFSAEAIRLLKSRDEYENQLSSSTRRIHAWVSDVAAPPGDARWAAVEALADALGGLHFLTFVFVLSALEAAQMVAAVRRAARLLRPGGLLFFRDYGAGDLAQRRLDDRGQTDGAGTYERGEGTLARYFSLEEVGDLFPAALFDRVELRHVERDITNRAQGVTMNRRWVQAKFARRGAPPCFRPVAGAPPLAETGAARRRGAPRSSSPVRGADDGGDDAHCGDLAPECGCFASLGFD